ncbi:hypothetical protein ACWQOS_002594 [Morganella morganii]
MIAYKDSIRLEQYSFANKLISLFNQFNNPELRSRLMWLCWFDLVLGFSLDDWLNTLKMKTEEQLVEWIIGKQTENWGLGTGDWGLGTGDWGLGTDKDNG